MRKELGGQFRFLSNILLGLMIVSSLPEGVEIHSEATFIASTFAWMISSVSSLFAE